MFVHKFTHKSFKGINLFSSVGFSSPTVSVGWILRQGTGSSVYTRSVRSHFRLIPYQYIRLGITSANLGREE